MANEHRTSGRRRDRLRAYASGSTARIVLACSVGGALYLTGCTSQTFEQAPGSVDASTVDQDVPGASGGSSGSPASASGGANGSSGGTVATGSSSSSGTTAGSSSSSGSVGGRSSSGGSSGGTGDDGGPSSGSSGAVSPDAGRSADGGVVDTSKKITVWLAGDSTMQPCGGVCPCGWGSQFQPYFNSNATVVDDGAGGRSLQTWLYEPNVSTTLGPNGECVVSPQTYSARWQSMLDPNSGMKPGDYLFIEFGINDTSATCDRHVGTALFQTLLGTMAKATIARGARPIFLTSTNAIICSGASDPPNRAFGPETKAAGLANNVPVIDLTTLSADFYTTLGLCPNDGNFASTTTPLGKFFCNDHTHFEAAGAAQIAGVVAKALRDQNIGLAAYLK